MRKVQIYVDNQRVDLFQDEKIEVKSSVQDIADIAKVFTDFSQAFTVPASDNNNAIFGYYYNNDNNTFDANNRVASRIEIDHNPFREGKLQLEGTIVKGNQIEAYKVTFYGDVVTLKDLIGEDKLKDLDFSSINQSYDGATVQDSITNTSYLDIRYPLISSSRVWTYNDGSGVDLLAHAIDFSELFPAISDSKIMSLIEDTYGVTFSGNFLTDDRFKNSYTWWKNRETTDFTTQAVDVTFNPFDLSCNANLPNNAVSTDIVNVQYIDMSTYTQPVNWQAWINTQQHRVDVFIHNTSGTNTWYLDVYKNGLLFNTITGSGDSLETVALTVNVFGLNDTYEFKVRSVGTLSFDTEVKYQFFGYYQDTSNFIQSFSDSCTFTTTGFSTVSNLDLVTTAPDQKVSDWLSGTLKEFNLTCYPLDDELTFQIEPLEDWYAGGDTVNITPYVDIDTIQYDRLKLYNEVTFKWQKSQSFMNTAFEGFNAREYGDLKEIFPNHDGGKYEVNLPFETMLFSNFDDINNNLQVGYCLTNAPDYKPYIPKPVKLYLQESRTCAFYFDNGTTVPQLTSYVPFGQEVEYNGQDYSMNFGEEIISLTLNPVSRSLYQTYYQPYMLNLFDTKSRKVTLQCVLPLNMLIRLSLDDALIVRDKKYRINDMTTDLTSGLVKLVLVSDWVKDRGVRTPVPPIIQTGGVIDVPIKPPKGGWIDIDNPVETKFITSSPTLPAINEDTEQRLVITVPNNATGANRYQTINYRGYKPDGTLEWSRTILIEQEGSSFFLLTESGGYNYSDVTN